MYIEDRDTLAVKGALWLEDVADMVDPRLDLQKLDLRVVYGAAKLAVDSTRPNSCRGGQSVGKSGYEGN